MTRLHHLRVYSTHDSGPARRATRLPIYRPLDARHGRHYAISTTYSTFGLRPDPMRPTPLLPCAPPPIRSPGAPLPPLRTTLLQHPEPTLLAQTSRPTRRAAHALASVGLLAIQLANAKCSFSGPARPKLQPLPSFICTPSRPLPVIVRTSADRHDALLINGLRSSLPQHHTSRQNSDFIDQFPCTMPGCLL